MSLCPFLFSCLDLKKNAAHMFYFKDLAWGTSKVNWTQFKWEEGFRLLFAPQSPGLLHSPSDQCHWDLSLYELCLHVLQAWGLYLSPHPPTPPQVWVLILIRHGGKCTKWSPAGVHCKRLVPRAPYLLGRQHREKLLTVSEHHIQGTDSLFYV